jgi:hypothetical protein
MSVMPYRCYFLGQDGLVVERHDLAAADDAAAVRDALGLSKTLAGSLRRY